MAETSQMPTRSGIRRQDSRFCSSDPIAACWFVRCQNATAAVVLLIFLGFGNATVSAQTFRFVFMGPKSPVLLEAQVQSGGWDLRRVRERYAAGAFQRLDQDHNGQLSPAEASRIPVSGRFSAEDEQLGPRWAELDVDPADEQLTEGELFSFLDRVLGPPLTVERQTPRLTQTVRLYAELDLNGDNSITPDEFAQGLQRLQQSDFDDDETLSVAELQPFPLSVVQARQAAEAQTPDSDIPLLLVSTVDERGIAAARIVAEYGIDGVVESAVQLGISERFFRVFDADKNGRMEASEVVRYLEKAPAQVNLSASLAPPMIGLGRISAPETVTVMEEGKRPVLNLAGVPVECVARNKASDLRDQVSLFKIRMRQSDADKNGYLDAGEFAGLQAPVSFRDVDLDENGQVTVEELDLFFTLDGLAAQSRLVATLSDEAKVLFNLLDANSDNRLVERELRAAPEVLAAYDQDGDGALASRELASRFRITFSQPELIDIRVDAGMNQQARQGVVREETSGPLWFRRMDRNLDGDLSWREFLGSRQDFDRVDADGDGLITLEEALQAEVLRRPSVP